MQVFIPQWHPTPLNKLMSAHWSKRAKMKRDDFEIIWLNTLGLGGQMVKKELNLTIFLGKGQRKCDPDAYFKSLLDGLVKAKLIVDDSDKWLRINNPKFVRRPENWGTHIELTTLDNKQE